MGWLVGVVILGAIPLGPKPSSDLAKVFSLLRDIWLLQQIDSLGLTEEQARKLVKILGEFHAPRLKVERGLKSLVKDLERAREYLLAGKGIPESLEKRLNEARKAMEIMRPTPERIKEMAEKLREVLKPEQWERASQAGEKMAVFGALMRGMALRRGVGRILDLLERIRGMSDEEFGEWRRRALWPRGPIRGGRRWPGWWGWWPPHCRHWCPGHFPRWRPPFGG